MLDQLKQLGPVITAGIAIVGAVLAIATILVQRSLVRKRGAIDFFLKSEMDQQMRVAYAKFDNAINVLKTDTPMATFRSSSDYADICGYLDILELFAIGIDNGIFDQRICYYYWSGVVKEACQDAKLIINDVREDTEDPMAYVQLTRLNARWDSPPRRWQRWRDEF